jgi:membrane protein
MAKNKFKFSDLWSLLKQTYIKWDKDDPWRNSAVIAYYAIFSLPGLLMIVIVTAGYFFGEAAVQGQISQQISTAMSADAAQEVENMLARSQVNENSWLATVVGIGILLFGATGVVYQLQRTINFMWGVQPKPDAGIKKLIIDRVFSFSMIVVIGFLLLVSMVVSATLASFSGWIMERLPAYMYYVFRVLNFVISFGIISVLFAAMFKILPDVKLKWKHVWVGAMVTAFLFVLGKFLLTIYFQFDDPTTTYGAAGSLILIMVWISYSSMILFFGAEFTYIYVKRYGSAIRPVHHAQLIPDCSDDQQMAGGSASTKDKEVGQVVEEMSSVKSRVAYVKDHSDK